MAQNKDSGLLEIRKRYLSVILAGDVDAAKKIITESISFGISPKSLYLYVIIPAQQKLGDLWQEGKISVAEEHRATNISIIELNRLRQFLKPKSKIGKKVLIASVEGDSHIIGGRIVADFLYLDGWDVEFLGSNTPTSDLISHIKKNPVDLLGLSVSTLNNIPSLRSALTAIKAELPKQKIIIGGSALNDSDSPKDFGVDGISLQLNEVGDLCRSIIEVPPAAAYLEQYLKDIGRRIAHFRRLKRLSQQQIADASGLDRAYISAVEHGKHNLTLGALMKLSEALEIAMEDLLLEEKFENAYSNPYNTPGLFENSKIETVEAGIHSS
jgi:MerR family transcriptional regulator, light-induced transcriptional regulator